MSKPLFTPGPLEAKRDTGLRWRICAEGGGTLAYLTARPFAHSANFSHGQIEANANLFAAAPDIYAALDTMVRRFAGACVNGLDVAAVAAARAALAKARGEQ